MDFIPRLRKEMRVPGTPDDISHNLVVDMPKNHITVQQHLPGIRVRGLFFRPFSFSWGVEASVEFHTDAASDNGKGKGEVGVTIESRFPFPWVDVTHENEKNVAMLEEMVRAASRTGSGTSAAAA